MHLNGKKISYISKKLKRSSKIIKRNIEKLVQTGNLNCKVGSGRKKLLSDNEVRLLTASAKRIPLENIVNIHKQSKMLNKDKEVDRKTLKRALEKKGIKCYKCAKKPRLTPSHKFRRLNLVKKWVNFDSSFWEKVIFSDESKFNINGNDGDKRVYRSKGTRYNPNHIIRTEKFGGGKSVMVWGYITSSGPGNLVFLDSSVNKEVYLNVLNDNLLDELGNFSYPGFKFQHDGAPAHKSILVNKFLMEKSINILDWTAQSPDLNPIENVWALIKGILGNHRFASLDEMKNKIREIWNNLSPEYCSNLINSMPSRVQEVIKAKGDITRY